MTTHCPVEIDGNPGLADERPGTHGLQVVAIQGDVERASGDVMPGPGPDQLGQPVGQLDTAALNADQHQPIGTACKLADFLGHTSQSPLNPAGI